MMWQPLVPVWLIAAMGMAACAAAVWWTWRSEAVGTAARGWLIGLRVAVVSAVVVMLLGPRELTDPQHNDGDVEVAVAMDTSGSMASGDVEPSRYRQAVAKWLSETNLSRLGEAGAVSLFAFAGDAEASTAEALRTGKPEGAESNIVGVVRRLVMSGPAERRAVVVISDGHDTRHASDARGVDRVMAMAQMRGVRVFAAPVGTRQAGADVSVSVAAEPGEVFNDQPVRITATLQRRGSDVREVTATLLIDGQTVQTVRAAFEEGAASRRIVFTDTPAVRRDQPQRTIDYAVRVEAAAHETDTANNEDHALVRLMGRRLAVLLLEGEPHWDTRFFAGALADDPQVVLTTMHAVTADRVMMSRRVGADGRTEDVSITLPLRDAMLDEFDVLALGRGMSWFFPGEQAGAIERFAREHGGGVVFVRGEPYGPDAAKARKIIELLMGTGDGGWRQTIRKVSPDGSKTARARRVRYGEGRAVVIEDDQLWRWTMNSDASGAWPAAYRGFVGEVVRWAAVGDGFVPSAAVTILPERISDAASVPRTVRVRLRQAADTEPMTLKVTGPNGKTSEVMLTSTGEAMEKTGVFTPTDPGVYELAVGEARAKLVATSSDQEMRDTAAWPELLARLAEGTGGAVLTDGDVGPVVAAMQQTGQAEAGRRAGAWAWAKWWALGALVAGLAVEWFSRRRLGLA